MWNWNEHELRSPRDPRSGALTLPGWRQQQKYALGAIGWAPSLLQLGAGA
jgi:hypothetical protein